MSILQNFSGTLLALAISSGTALAGSPEPVSSPPVVTAPAPAPGYDWTGIYIGVHYGTGDITEDGTTESWDVFGAQVGYLHDFGTWVLGGELSYSEKDPNFATMSDFSAIDLKARAGYDGGRILPYIVLGIGELDVSMSGSDSLFIYGLGAEYAVTDNVRVALEYLIKENSDFTVGGSTTDVSEEVLTLRLNYAF